MRTKLLFSLLVFALTNTVYAAVSADQLQNCKVCHTKQEKSLTRPDTLGAKHATKGISNCTFCHTQAFVETTHKDVAVGETKFIPAKKYGPEECTKCHSDEKSLKQRTAQCTVLTDSKGKVINPHDLPNTPNHAKITCSNCHKIHKKPVDVNRQCYGCHHTKEYTCTGCHNQK